MNEEIKLEPLHYVPYIYYFNILTGEVALSNNEYLWLSKNPATIMPPEQQIVGLACGDIEQYQGWIVAMISDEIEETAQVFISESDFDRFLLHTSETNRSWQITDAETGEPAPYLLYVTAICAQMEMELSP